MEPVVYRKLSQYSKEVPELRGMLDQASAKSVRLQSKCKVCHLKFSIVWIGCVELE